MDYKTFQSIVNLENNDVTRENGNINADTPAGMMMKFASSLSKEAAIEYMLSDEAKEYLANNLIHIHDLDYYPTKAVNCFHHPLDKILEHGFVASDGTARPCKRIETATALAAISMQTIQNEQFGGQAIPAWDFYIAPYVQKTFEEEIRKACNNLDEETISGIIKRGLDYVKNVGDYLVQKEPSVADYTIQMAINHTVRRTHQAIEAFVHNMNTMRSRGGGQTVFSSINYGTDTSPEGRLVIRETLNCINEGVGNGQTAIFPISIFKCKKGVNVNHGDPNYDLFEFATAVTAKRFFPNYINLDAPFNKSDKWDANDPKRYMYEPATMGCRTRVFEDRYGESTSVGRGNLSFTTINLPRLALMSKNYAEFLIKLEETIDVVVNQLLDRLNWQRSALAKQFPMLMSGMWKGSENLKANDPVDEVLLHGTLGVGYIGLAEALIVLTGSHHGQSAFAQKMGLEIITEMSERCKQLATECDVNISLFATPAEGLSGKFVKKDKVDFGIIEGVTDKDFYTNSNHVPVDFKISYVDKMRIEAPYHALTPAGHIAYVEVDGNAENNPKAIRDIVLTMLENNIGYGSVNFARARCLDCGYEDGSDKFDECPKCKSANVDVIERITGYLVGSTNRWNSGKLDELKHRVSHISGNYII